MGIFKEGKSFARGADGFIERPSSPRKSRRNAPSLVRGKGQQPSILLAICLHIFPQQTGVLKKNQRYACPSPGDLVKRLTLFHRPGVGLAFRVSKPRPVPTRSSR